MINVTNTSVCIAITTLNHVKDFLSDIKYLYSCHRHDGHSVSVATLIRAESLLGLLQEKELECLCSGSKKNN